MHSTPVRAPTRTKSAARLALALALASGMAIGTPFAAPAFAKDKQQEAKPEGNSKAFADAYAPMQKIINDPAGDFASAKAMVPTIQAAIQNPTDKNTFGLALIALGEKVKDVNLQKQGIQLSLESGKADQAQVGLFHYFLGQWAYEAKNYDEARNQLQAAIQAGYTTGDPGAIIAETYFGQGQGAQGLQYLSDLIAKRTAAGQQIPDTWYRRGLKVAYDSKLAAQADDYAMMLVEHYPTPTNWQAALQVVNALGQFDADGQLNLFRLMKETGSLKEKHDYLAYVDAVDPRKMSTEALAVLDQGVKSGAISTSDTGYQQAKSIADTRVANEKSLAASVAADAPKSSDPKVPLGAANLYFSTGAYDKAAEMYKLALDKGIADKGLAQTELGIAQVKSGQLDAAKATLQQVTGPRAPVARMWLAYIASKSAPPAPPAPPSPPA
jgi:tetratricopeptide (TPR) repeat protein